MKDPARKWHQLRADARHFASMSRSATDPSQRELFKRLGDQLAIEALELDRVPEHLIVLKALPRNALSKVDRATLQAMAIDGDKAPRSRGADQPSRRAS